jgi:hypothetical protein
MTSVAKNYDSVATGQRFVNAIAHRAWDELATYLDDAVQFRGLTGKGLFSADDRASATGHVKTWFGWLDQLALLSSEVQPMHDRLHISYRFRAHKDQWYLIEQQAYCLVEDGQIKQIYLVCSGFRPEVTPQLQ